MPTKEQLLRFGARGDDLYEDQLRTLFKPGDPRNQTDQLRREAEDKERGGA